MKNRNKKLLAGLGLIIFSHILSSCSEQVSDNSSAKNETQTSNPVVETWMRSAHKPSDPHGELTVDQFIKVALQHQQEGRPFEALGTLSDAIEKHPMDGELLFIRSQLLGQSESFAEALADIEKAIELESNVAVFRINRAQLYRKFGRYEQAMQDLNKAIELDNSQLAAFFNRGALKYSQQDLEGALNDFNECIALDPHAPAPYFNRATVYQDLAQTENALADLDRFLQISNNPGWNEVATEMKTEWSKATEGNS